ncbi:MAG: hypothetical protein AVDCRST_MAG08-4087 [uncultured Acetobacteraceae bacterium]|uniref:Uncharacterized protein n=1 Tax=uncultured Acetobacteraceae bacterium TaxID=169975 RepID=A0A6J4JQM3_9PROT|nr:MAG: hypothetical protein AVDCRST_MAG08-4087 [uncultured Acetobacteraceae bacterium]
MEEDGPLLGIAPADGPTGAARRAARGRHRDFSGPSTGFDDARVSDGFGGSGGLGSHTVPLIISSHLTRTPPPTAGVGRRAPRR